MDEAVKIFSTVGFPVFIALFVLIRLETALKHLTAAVQELRACLIGRKAYRSTDPPPESPV